MAQKRYCREHVKKLERERGGEKTKSKDANQTEKHWFEPNRVRARIPGTWEDYGMTEGLLLVNGRI